MLLQLLQTIVFLCYWFVALLLALGVVGLIGAVTTLLQFKEGDITKLVIFDIGMAASLFALHWALNKLNNYRFGPK